MHGTPYAWDALCGDAVWGGPTLLTTGAGSRNVIGNQLHLVLRSRPDVVAVWDDTDVARRWLMLCPLQRDEHGQPVEPTEFELNRIRNDKDRLAEIRLRLSDISWWMRLLSQNIAQ